MCVGKDWNTASELFAKEKKQYFSLDFFQKVQDFPLNTPNFSKGPKSTKVKITIQRT